MSFKEQPLTQIQRRRSLSSWVSSCCTDTGIWGSLVKSPGGVGGWVVLKFDVFRHWDAVFCAVCMQVRKHSVANVLSQQAVKLVVVGPRLFEQCCFGLYLGDQRQ